MQLVVGLGNPGLAYAKTRHNLGFHVLDEVANRQGLEFSTVSGLYAWARWNRATTACIFLKPLTYMNLSGRALVAWAVRNSIRLDGTGAGAGVDPIVVCDDLALPLGAVRIRARGSDGGQKGLASIIQALGGQVFPRVRLGIGPGTGSVVSSNWATYVLEPFAREEIPLVRELVVHAADALLCLLAAGPEVAASRFNRSDPPAAEGKTK